MEEVPFGQIYYAFGEAVNIMSDGHKFNFQFIIFNLQLIIYN
jgi:hypothetical protein